MPAPIFEYASICAYRQNRDLLIHFASVTLPKATLPTRGLAKYTDILSNWAATPRPTQIAQQI